MSIVRLLKKGPKYFGDIQKYTNFSPRIVDKHLTLLVNDGLVTRNHMGKHTLYSLTQAGTYFSNNAPYSLIWELFELQQNGAWYITTPSYSYQNYGLEHTFARIPNIINIGDEKSVPTGKAMDVLDTAFLNAMKEVIKSKNMSLEPAEGNFLVAFMIDWAKFSKKIKETEGVIKPRKPSTEDLQRSRAIRQLKDGEILDSDRVKY